MKCVSPVYVRKAKQFVPCSKCAACIEKFIKGWIVRVRHETAISSAVHFFTFTYDEQHVPEGNELVKSDLQIFFRALRHKNPGIRYFAVGEYGEGKGRPHYHAIIWNIIDRDLVNESWPHGHIQGSKLKGAGGIKYMLKYMMTPHPAEDIRQKPFRLMSRRPGIGSNYISQMKRFHKSRGLAAVYDFSTASAMPRYYKNHIFNVHERATLTRKAMEYSEQNPEIFCPVQYDRLVKSLQKGK